jgi:two-component system, chemotaxis family, chemotaxis protein CheY
MITLLVDDSPAMRGFIKRVLKLSGLEIDTILEAANGLEAMNTVRSVPVDLVLCDINMPEMNGEQLMTALASEGCLQQVRVVVVSTDATSSRVDRMMRLGARGYLKKPFTPEELRETVERAMEADSVHNT